MFYPAQWYKPYDSWSGDKHLWKTPDAVQCTDVNTLLFLLPCFMIVKNEVGDIGEGLVVVFSPGSAMCPSMLIII